MSRLRSTLTTALAALAAVLVVPLALAAPALAQYRAPDDGDWTGPISAGPTAAPPTVITHDPSVWSYVGIVAATVLVTVALTLIVVAVASRHAPQLRRVRTA